MADDADRATPRIEQVIELGIMQVRSAPALARKGRCHFCDESVAHPLLFCSADCAQDFENEDDQLKRMGRNG